jgi:hypothetical protein
VWHGSADRTVNSANATEIVKQWLDVHRLPEPPMSETVVDGHARRIWWDADGETVVESYTVANLGHGTPLGLAEDDKRYGRQGPFLLEAGISSSYHIAKFFGLTGWIRDARPSFADSPSAKLIPSVSPIAPRPPPETAEVPRRERRAPVAGPIKPKVKAKKRRALHHVGAAISRALMAAGLMK